MQRYFILDESKWTNQSVTITGDDVHHLLRVMRKRPGDKIICTNKAGRAAFCIINEINEDKVLAEIAEWLDQNTELPIKVTIVQSLPKGDKLEYILQKGTELGATQFIPFKAERSIVHWDQKKVKKKFSRFEKIIKEASEQSQRQSIPDMEEPIDLRELINISKAYDYKIFAYEEEAKGKNYQSFASILKRMKPGMQLLICIGPEGGFSMQEAEALSENEFHAVRFGPRILRTETAALYGLASISYHFEELGYS